MKYINEYDQKPVDKVRTTIGVRLATKYLLLDNSLPGESLDDTLVRILHENNNLSRENSRLVKIIEDNKIQHPALFIESSNDRGIESIEIQDGTSIHFSYNIPDDMTDLPTEYVMDMVIEKVFRKGKKSSFDDLPLSEKDKIVIMFKMIEKVINLHFDKGYELPGKTFLIDPLYWRKVYSRVGLPNSSYLNDVLKVIQEYESGSYG